MRERTCLWCENYFMPENPKQTYCCVGCREEAARKRRMLRDRRKKKPTTIYGCRQPKVSIAEICKRAKEAGLSYGKYVEKYGV